MGFLVFKEQSIKYIPLVLLCTGVTKAFICPPTWTEVVLLAVIAASAGFYQFFMDESRFKAMHTRLDTVDAHLTALYKSDEELKNHITGIKVSQNMKTTNIFGSKSQ